MNKKLKIFSILLLLFIIFLPIKNVSADDPRYYRYKIPISEFSPGSSSVGDYTISNAVTKKYHFEWLFLHTINEDGKTYLAYCMHYFKSTDYGRALQKHSGFAGFKDSNGNIFNNANQQQLLLTILASGYQSSDITNYLTEVSRSDHLYTCGANQICKEIASKILATQILAWEVVDGARTNYNEVPNYLSNNSYSYVSGRSALLKAYKQILADAQKLTGVTFPESLNNTVTLTWNDSLGKYTSGNINIGEYNVGPGRISNLNEIKKDINNNINITADKAFNGEIEIPISITKGNLGGRSTFDWYSFKPEDSNLQDLFFGNYSKTYTKNMKVRAESGEIKIRKINSDTKKDLLGSKFQIYKCNNNGSCNTKVELVDLTKKAQATIKLNKSGTYKFVELQTPGGYKKIGDFTVYINLNSDTARFTNISNSAVKINSNNKLELVIPNESIDFRISKIDGDTKSEVKGAAFQITNPDGKIIYKFNKDDKTGKYIYDENGKLDTIVDSSSSIYSIAALPKNKEYIIKEVSVPYPYVLSSKESDRQTAIRINDNNALLVYNYNKKAYEPSPNATVTVKNFKTIAEIIKKGKGNVKLQGVVFELYDKDKKNQISLVKVSDGVYDYPDGGKGSPVQLVTNDKGKITINNLPTGVYNMKEVKPADGYVIDPSVEWRQITVTVNRDGQPNSEKNAIEWPNTQGEFCFYKIDEDGNYLTDGKFKIQVYDEKTSKYNDVSLIYHNKEKNYTIDETGKSDIYTFSPIANGETCFVEVKAKGKYRIVEIEAPEGFILPKVSETKADFVVNENGYIMGNTTIINKKITIGEKADAQAELIVNISTGQQRIRYIIIISVILVFIAGLIILNKKIGKK